MMISPDLYIEEKQNWSLEELYKEKQNLENYIRDYKQGKLKDIITKPSPQVIASIYEEYIIELIKLIESKEKEKAVEKHVELTDYDEIEDLLQRHNFFEGYRLYEIEVQDGDAKVVIIYGEHKVEFFLTNVDDFSMIYFTNDIYFDSISVNNIDGKYSIEIDENGLYISAEKIKLKTVDLESTIYTYISVKYKEEQERTFYYISNIDGLEVGDYVWVPVRNTTCPGIVTEIEQFQYDEVPFPVSRTKKVLRKSSKEEFEEYINKKINIFDDEDEDFIDDDDFEYEEKETLRERAKKLPYIKTQNVEWKSYTSKDNIITPPYPEYNEEIIDWVEAFYDLDLADYNYVENYKEKVKNKDIEDLSFQETLTYLTYIIRGERFCDGLLATNLANGVIEKLEKNLFSYIMDYIEINNENLNEFTEENIMFFTLAEFGAMGEPGGIEIVTKIDNTVKFYHTNLKTFDNETLSFKLKTLRTLRCDFLGCVTGVQDGFTHVNTGFGNHLFVNNVINDPFQEQIKRLRPEEIYGKWLRKALDLLGYDWSNIN